MSSAARVFLSAASVSFPVVFFIFLNDFTNNANAGAVIK